MVFMTNKLKGKVAIVTGSSKGIGASIALHLAVEGASVVVNYSKSKAKADKVVAEIVQNGGKAIAIQANMAKQSDIERLFSETKKAFGKLDILVNNAGIYEFALLQEITPEHFYKIFDLNVLGLLLSCKEALKYFGESGGSIVNISAIASTVTGPTLAVYGASKAAVDSITRNLSQELGCRNIRVNAINPALTDTEGVHDSSLNEGGDWRKEIEARIPLGRLGRPRDIALAVLFLASDDASWITGETLRVSGGYR